MSDDEARVNPSPSRARPSPSRDGESIDVPQPVPPSRPFRRDGFRGRTRRHGQDQQPSRSRTDSHTPPWNPHTGTKTGPAWRAIVDNLTTRERGSLEIATDIAMRAGQIKRSTARSLIKRAIREGHLQTRTQPTTRSRTYQQIRLTHKAHNLTTPNEAK